MSGRDADLAYPRLKLFTRLCFVWGLIIVARLFQLQILNHDEYARQAQQQQEHQIEVRAPRGIILDRNNQPLAMSVAVDSVCVNPLRIPDIAVASEILSRVLDLDSGELRARLASAVETRRGFLWIKRKLSLEESERLRAYNFDWLEFRSESSRYYPKGALAAHVLGGVDHEEKGNGGVEQFFDKDLKGTPGIMRATADVRQNVFDLKVYSDPQPGTTLQLAIDERIQYVAEQEIAKAVKEHHANFGTVVVMDPNTGDVIALANYPSYNPNEPPTDKASFEARKNLAVMAPFEPGSVFKVITLSAAFETTNLRPETMFHCGNGSFTLFRRVIHDAHPYGMLSAADVLAKSSNIGAIKIGLMAGNENLYNYVKKFGFGERTGIPLPGEGRGVVRKLDKWIASSIGSVAMGHEISATALQLARACSVVANGGRLMRPRLVLSKRRGDEAPVEIKPEGTQILKAETANTMRRLMQGVVEYGTGKLTAQVDGYSAAGKTGSAQLYDYATRHYTHHYNGSFMGFAPVNRPALVIAVTLNNTAKFGGVVAGPVFKQVMQQALRLLDVPKDRPEAVAPAEQDVQDESDAADPDPLVPPVQEDDENNIPSLMLASAGADGTGRLVAAVVNGPKAPDFRGKTKRQVIAESVDSGIHVEMVGLGVARRQFPAPGALLEPGERVRVVFAR